MYANDELDADIGRCCLEEKEIQRISAYPYARSVSLSPHGLGGLVYFLHSLFVTFCCRHTLDSLKLAGPVL